MKNLKQALNKIVSIIKGKNKEDIKSLLLNLLLLLLLVCFIKLPIILVRDIFLEFFVALNNYTESALNTYYLIFNIIYAIVAVIAALKFITKKYN